MPNTKENILREIMERRVVVTTELRETVRSKVDVGKFFAGFITLLIGILLKDGELDSELSKLGIVVLISSLGFCVAAVFCYDRLLMPRKYWKEMPEDQNTEESFQNCLCKEMDRFWKILFVPAVVCFGVGFILAIAEPIGVEWNCSLFRESNVWFFLLLVGFVVPAVVFLFSHPKMAQK